MGDCLLQGFTQHHTRRCLSPKLCLPHTCFHDSALKQ